LGGTLDRLRRAILLIAGFAIVCALRLGAIATAAPAVTPNEQAARSDASAFLARYLRSDGRVARLDQGNDTVSAGQAQAMLITVAVGDRRRFALTWAWTLRHLVRADHLLASRWRAGRIVDAQPASDADLDAARALLLAAQRFHAPRYRRAGLQIARSVLTHETAVRGGVRVLLPGPWARTRGTVNPGYWAPRTLSLLAAATHDKRYRELERGAIRLARALTAASPHLPPDWAAVSTKGSITATAAPPGHPSAAPGYSLDAARLPIRFGEACDAQSRAIAASVWPFFAAQGPTRIGAAYALDGRLTNPEQAAITLIGAAAAAQAAGQPAARDALFAQAETINARFPTYYGSAWVALGRIELTTSLLGGCH
jgi:endo-1,4-beta-D-glucanase Y